MPTWCREVIATKLTRGHGLGPKQALAVRAPNPPGTVGAGALKPFPRTVLLGLGRTSTQLYPRVCLCSSAVQSLPHSGVGCPSRGGWEPGAAGGRRAAPELFDRNPETAEQPRPSHAATTRPPQLPPRRNPPDVRAHAPG